tara:strand:+ start:1180 stop:1671 length:492 start_codon:yes stop_codon:yes gene_type:complete
MTEQAYDEKNERDYDDITESINDGLLEIRRDPNLKTTIRQLEKLSGVHRNTIGNREWPKDRLKEIALERKVEAELKKKVASSEPKPLEIVTDRLEKAHLEILHWFKKYNEITELYENSKESIKYLTKSKNSCALKVEALEKDLAQLRAEYERVCDLLNTVREK